MENISAHKLSIYGIILFLGLLSGLIYLYAFLFSSPMTFTSKYLSPETIIACLFLIIIYLIYIWQQPEASIPFIICSSWAVIFEPAPTDIFAVLAIVAFISRFLFKQRMINRIYGRDILLLIFLALHVNSPLIGANDIFSDLRYVSITLYLAIMSFLISNMSDSFYTIRKQLNLLLIPCVITSFLLFLGILGGFNYINLGSLHEILLFEGRPKAFFKDPNVAGPSLILPAVYSLATLLYTKKKNKFIYFSFLSLSIIGIFLTFSRGSILALIISVIIVSLIPNTRKASLKIFVSLVLIFVLAYGVLSYLPKSNIYERIVDTQFGVRDRLERIERGVKAFKQSPLLGTGMELALDRAPHDSYFLLLQQVGLIGFICFSLPLVYLIWKLLTNSILCKNENEKIIYLSLAATLFSHLVIGSVINFIHWRHLWYLIGLSMAAVHLFAAGDQKLDEETRELGIRLGQ